MVHLPGESVSILAVVCSCSYPTPFAMHQLFIVSFYIVQFSLIVSLVSNTLRPKISRPFHRRCHSSLPSRSRHHLYLRLLVPEHHSCGHSDHTFPVPRSDISVRLLLKTPFQRSAHSSQKSPRMSSPRSFCTSLPLHQRSRPFYWQLLNPAPRHSLSQK